MDGRGGQRQQGSSPVITVMPNIVTAVQRIVTFTTAMLICKRVRVGLGKIVWIVIKRASGPESMGYLFFQKQHPIDNNSPAGQDM